MFMYFVMCAHQLMQFRQIPIRACCLSLWIDNSLGMTKTIGTEHTFETRLVQATYRSERFVFDGTTRPHTFDYTHPRLMEARIRQGKGIRQGVFVFGNDGVSSRRWRVVEKMAMATAGGNPWDGSLLCRDGGLDRGLATETTKIDSHMDEDQTSSS